MHTLLIQRNRIDSKSQKMTSDDMMTQGGEVDDKIKSFYSNFRQAPNFKYISKVISGINIKRAIELKR